MFEFWMFSEWSAALPPSMIVVPTSNRQSMMPSHASFCENSKTAKPGTTESSKLVVGSRTLSVLISEPGAVGELSTLTSDCPGPAGLPSGAPRNPDPIKRKS